MSTSTEHRALLQAAQRCVAAQDRFPDDSADHKRAGVILAELAGHCRAAATVFDIDPTLADEPYDTGRFRWIDVLVEMTRQAKPLLTQACGDRHLDRWPRAERWAEIEALTSRAAQIAEAIPRVVPRRDHDTEAGSRAISRDRLAVHARDLALAAESVRDATQAARRLPHPDPMVLALAALAEQLERHAGDLAAHRETQLGDLDAAFDLRPPDARVR